MSISRRSYTRGAMFGNIPDYIGSPMTRRPSDVMSTSSAEDDRDREGSFSDESGDGDDLHQTRQSSVNIIADLFAGIVYSLQAPFYPQEAEKKGATPTEYGLVFGVFELTMFLVSPFYGKFTLDQIQDRVWFIGLSFLIRILEASGNAGFSTASFTIIACEFPDSVATTFASLETFFGLGLIVGPTMGGWTLSSWWVLILPFAAVTGALLFFEQRNNDS
ncbi:MFS-type transporter SLC18B1 [Orchesella cincta]|uniref:MFS-type transporter SLC18B1 n=1 Tax=Orchesella cincta TaxID=48709 RepID=A0A1D2M463_ORCCI|nr:MFS-type transporter SLC18B1 [Orchesella cincta]